MKNLIFTLAITILLLVSGSAYAANWYVSTSGNNTTGASWATAWNECSQINWASVAAGDSIFIDGGSTSMTYSTGVSVGKAGTVNSRITIIRSTASGHNGIVTIRGFSTNYAYITLNGIDRNKFIIEQLDPQGGYMVFVQDGANYFEIWNAYLKGDYSGSTGGWGELLMVNGSPKTVLIKGCGFYQTNSEDQLRFDCSNGTLTVEDCYFSNLTAYGGQHSDVLQLYSTGVNMTWRRCMMYNTTGYMMEPNQGNIAFYDCAFINCADVGGYSSGSSLIMYNNTFHNCRVMGGSYTSYNVKNNIFTGTNGWGSEVYTGTGQYCLWNDVPSGYNPGTGNLHADPLYVNINSPLGADGIPFTNDDGFRLTSNSPAINAGTNVGLTTDILNNPIVGNPDIGAYEYQSGGDTQAPSVPTGLASSSITQTSFTLNWTASTDNVGVTGYEVFKNGASIGTSASASMSVTGLTANTTYSMTVRARDAVPNWSAQSTALNVTTQASSDTQAPSVPTGLASSNITQTSFTLSWTASTDNVGVTGYEVFKNGASIGTSATTSMSVTGLTASTSYAMTVRARDAVPNWSAQSTALNVTTLASGAVTSSTTWQSFTVSTQTGTFTAAFDAVPNTANMNGVTGIQNGTATAYSQLACAARFYTTGLIEAINGGDGVYSSSTTVNYSAGTSYHFRLVINVTAHTYSIYVTPNGQGEITLGTNYAFRSQQAGVTQLTGWSLLAETGTHTVSNVTFTAGDTQAPSVPTGLTSSSITQTSFTLNWTASTDNVGVTGYEVFKNGASIGTSATTSMSVTGLTASTTYSMTVRARDAVPNWSAQSTALIVTTASAGDTQAPSVPTGLTSSSIAQTSFTLNWTASTDNVGVTGYEVFKNGASIGTSASASMSVTGLTASTTYSMTVRARDAVPNWSAQSTALKVMTASASVTSSTTWQSFTRSTQTGTFTAAFDAVPNTANMNGVTGIQNGTATNYPNLACAVRFYTAGKIEAINGGDGVYSSSTTVNYSAGTSYHFRLVINVTAHTYSIYVTPNGQGEVTLGTNYAFRSQQAGVTQLTGWSLVALTGTHTVSNMTFGTSGKISQAENNESESGNNADAILSKPVTFSLSQNYPNPFNPTTNIEYRIANTGFVSLKIYDVLGREVSTLVNGQKSIGIYTVQWDASNLPSGVYFSRLTVQTQEGMPIVMTKKILFTK